MTKDIALKLAYEALWITNHLNMCGKFATIDPVKADFARFAIKKALENIERPPQREWVGLTDEEMREVYGKDLKYKDGDYARYARAIEAKLRSKNT